MPLQTTERAMVHVVDDDAPLREALEGLFESVGLDTRTYATANDFLSATPPDKPGCVIVDIRLPDMNGSRLSGPIDTNGGGTSGRDNDGIR